MIKFIKQKLFGFARNDRGTVTAEFVIIMPLFALMFVASYTFFDSFKKYRDAQNITFTVSDIISRYTEIGDTEIKDLNNIFDAVMGAADGDTYLRVTSVTENFDSIRIDWSRSTNGNSVYATLSDLPTEDIPILSTGETVIIVESSYPFVPGFGGLSRITEKEYLNRSIVTPRFAGRLEYVAVVAGS
ncbi:MAG: hypothetical protein KUG74_05870 [Rhodobacteraceae bacterium]|nr:hypothetical protein [Paracoccaceae bacterium]